MINKKHSVKLSILITVFIVVSLFGCFSHWQGDLAKIVISFGGAERKDYDPKDTDTHQKLKHKVTLTSAAETLNFSFKGNTTFEAYVAPGDWNVKVCSYLDNVIYAVGSKNVTLKIGQNNETISMNKGYNATEIPSITGPVNNNYSPSTTLSPMSVTASVNDGGTLSYQWYSNTTASNSGGKVIEGATDSTYKPAQNIIGTYYYYVVVTNTNPHAVQTKATITSNVAVLSIPIPSPNATFTVNTATKYQYIRGFGVMDNPWNFKELTIANYEKLYHPGNMDDPGNTSSDNGLGYNIMKIMLYPWNTDPDITMTQLLAGTANVAKPSHRPNQYEGVKIVNKYGGYVLAASWSPPAAWKTNGSILGLSDKGNDSLKTAYYQEFADYLNAYAKNFANHGAPIYAIGIQHEPDYSKDDYEGCKFSIDQHLNFWNMVGHFTGIPGSASGYGGGKAQKYVRTMSGEPVSNLSYLNNVANSTSIDIMGRHGYGSTVDPTSTDLAWGNQVRLNRENAGKETWMTEHNINSDREEGYPNDSTWAYVWKFMNDVDLTIRLNKDNAFIWWMAKRFYGMIGDGEYNTTENVILPRGYGLSHYAKFAKEMRQVTINTTGTNKDGANLSSDNINPISYSEDNTAAKVTAFMSQDEKTISLVMMTPTDFSGNDGQNMGIVRLALPNGYTIGNVVAMRTTAAEPMDRNANNVTEIPIISADRKVAYVSLPAGNILSVRFTKQ